MLVVVLGLSGALAYGFADFLGGMAARRMRPLAVTAVTATVGIGPLVLSLAFLGGRFTPSAVLWGAAAGVSGSIGVFLLYAALSVGPMSVLSPVTSVFSAVLPVVVAIAGGARLSLLALTALIVAIVAVVFVSISRDRSGARLAARGLLMAVVAGCGFGGLVLAYDLTSPADGTAPLVVARVVQAALAASALLVTRKRVAGTRLSAGQRPPLSKTFWVTAIVCGVLDATANALIQAALHASTGPATLPTVSVLNALYPVGTVVLASIVLRERLSAVQIGGIGLGIAASIALALN